MRRFRSGVLGLNRERRSHPIKPGVCLFGFPVDFYSRVLVFVLQSSSAMLMQSTSVESTRSIPKNMSPDRFDGGFSVSGFCCALDEPRADSASLMHPIN